MRRLLAAVVAGLPLGALADERLARIEAPGAALPWMWILLAAGAVAGVFLVWAWGHRIPPPAQPWR